MNRFHSSLARLRPTYLGAVLFVLAIGCDGKTAVGCAGPSVPPELDGEPTSHLFRLTNATDSPIRIEADGCQNSPGWISVGMELGQCGICQCWMIARDGECPHCKCAAARWETLPAGESVEWKWGGTYYERGSVLDRTCWRRRVPTTETVTARFCWKRPTGSAEPDRAVDPTCVEADFAYDRSETVSHSVQ